MTHVTITGINHRRKRAELAASLLTGFLLVAFAIGVAAYAGALR